ncbi:MAG: MFS transporter [Spirochaetales bacterium]|nr:MFS transporter [Spirochaetales bacterium]
MAGRKVQDDFKVYPYRWVILGAFMLITILIEIQWLTHAPVARAAEAFYAGQFNPDSLFNIDFLSMSYMFVFLLICIPASYIIDTWGIRVGLGIGALLTGIFSLLKGFGGANFKIVLIAQLGLAVAQPFILNAVTAVTVRWFPLRERGMAAGLSALAQYLGIILVMAVTPLMIASSPLDPAYGSGIDRMLMIYGIAGAAGAFITLILIKEAPPTPPSSEKIEHKKFSEGIKYILGNKNMILTIILFFIGLGIFNAVSSMVDSISASLGVRDSDGLIGVLMLAGGVLGAVIIPTLSDKFRKRKLFLVICIGGMIPGVLGLSFADVITPTPSAAYGVALTASFILGFFVMSAGPVGFQYAAEVSSPAPESTSQGILLLAGQISGLVFVGGMSIRDNLYLGRFMNLFVILSIVAFIMVTRLTESPMIITEKEKYSEFVVNDNPVDPA